ncbi:MAG: NTF2-like N-terminal transpeptidase domain-containing protein, partial [Chloroflexota bacterium]
MKSHIPLLLILLLILFSSIACSSKPSPYSAFEPFLKAWEEGRYGDMYDLLSSKAQESISREQFIQRY